MDSKLYQDAQVAYTAAATSGKPKKADLVDLWSGVHMFSAVRSSAFATNVAQSDDGILFAMAGLMYEVDSGATGVASCTNDLGVDGIVPHGPAQIGHFGELVDGDLTPVFVAAEASPFDVVYCPYRSGGYSIDASLSTANTTFAFAGEFKDQLTGSATIEDFTAVEGVEVGSRSFDVSGIPIMFGGNPQLLSVSNHTPRNSKAPVLTGGDYLIEYKYPKMKEISHFHMMGDDACAPYAIDFGTSVGTESANLSIWAAFSAYYDAGAIYKNPLFSTPGTVTGVQTSDRVTINHELTGDSDAPVVSNGGTTPLQVVDPSVSYGSTSIVVEHVNTMSGFASTADGVTWTINTDNVQGPTGADYNFVAPIASGTVRLETAPRPNISCIVTSHSLAHDVVVRDASSTAVEIAFVDRATGLIAAPAAGMGFHFSFSAKCKSNMPSDARFSMRRGNVRVLPAGFEQVGFNGWASGRGTF